MCSVQYAGSYEASAFAHNTADGITMLSVVGAGLLALDAASRLLRILPFKAFFHGPSLIFSLMYLWSKHNPDAQVGVGVRGGA